MPDEPTTRPGDTGSHSATFGRGVEKVDESTGQVPAGPSDRPAGQSPPADSPRAPGAPRREDGPSNKPPTDPERPSPATGSGPHPPKADAGGADRLARRPPGPVTGPSAGVTAPPESKVAPARSKKVRARKVKRIVRHVEPWSVLKVSALFYAALFLIVCVASALLWSTARSTGTVENVEGFITSVGGFGNCEPIDGAPSATTTTTVPGATTTTAPVDQLDPTGTDSTLPAESGAPVDESPDDDDDCREGTELVGDFKFEDARIFQAFVLGGIVLVLAGTAANVILVLLFNLMSDLTGGVRVTVLEEESAARTQQRRSGSPPPQPRD